MGVGVTPSNLAADASATHPLFPEDQRRVRLAEAVDAVNARFGPLTLYFGAMHAARDAVPTRIAYTRSAPQAGHAPFRPCPSGGNRDRLRLVFGIDRHGVGHFHTPGRPGTPEPADRTEGVVSVAGGQRGLS